MKILVIHKSTIEQIPPVLSAINILCDLSYNVVSISTGVTASNAQLLKEKGVDVHVVKDYKGANRLKKIVSYYNFRKQVLTLIEEYAKKDDLLLWIEGAYTILSLGTIIKKYKYILQISELHETYKYQLNAIKHVIHDAELVFMPEYNRTVLYKFWFNLKKRPIVLPNKPYFYPNEGDIEKLMAKYENILSIFKSKKVILYQGQIEPTRDLSNYIKAVKNIGEDFCIVLLGNDHNMVSRYKEIDENLVHINFIPAPDYLIFTSMAYIGILTYNPSSLNNMYCAPNKIYEYSRYSLPMLGNDIPGLKYAIEPYNAGVIVDEDSVESIEKGILKIDKNYNHYKENSARIYVEQDNKEIIRRALENIIN